MHCTYARQGLRDPHPFPSRHFITSVILLHPMALRDTLRHTMTSFSFSFISSHIIFHIHFVFDNINSLLSCSTITPYDNLLQHFIIYDKHVAEDAKERVRQGVVTKNQHRVKFVIAKCDQDIFHQIGTEQYC